MGTPQNRFVNAVNGQTKVRFCVVDKFPCPGLEIAILTLRGPITGLKRIGNFLLATFFCSPNAYSFKVLIVDVTIIVEPLANYWSTIKN